MRSMSQVELTRSRVLVPMAVLSVGSWMMIVWFWKPSVLTLTVDDTFYSLKTAANAGAGRGFTFDGLHPTNGFHPLWMVFLVPIAMIFGSDIEHYVRIALSVQIVLVLIGVRCLLDSFVSTRRMLPWLAVMLPFLSFGFTKIFVNGLESALEFACIGLTTFYGARLEKERTEDEPWLYGCVLGLLAAATTLSRLSAVAFAVPLLSLYVVRRSVHQGMRALIAYLAPLGTYALFNYRTSGSVIPVNAAIKGVPVVPSGVYLVAALMIVGAVAVVGALLLRSYGQGRAHARAVALPIVAYAVAEAAYDFVVRGILLPEIWYFVPHAALCLLVIAESAQQFTITRARGLSLVAVYVACVANEWCIRVRPESYSPYVAARRAGQWLRDNTDERAVIAGWDCGIMAMWSRRNFINLDGLINSWAYKKEVLDTGRVQDYLEQPGIDYLAQPFRLKLFERNGPVIYKNDVDLSNWHILYADCYEFRSFLRLAPERMVSLVLSRTGEGPRLVDFKRDRVESICSAFQVPVGTQACSLAN